MTSCMLLPQDYVAELLQKARIKQAGTSHDPESIRITVYCLVAKVTIIFRNAILWKHAALPIPGTQKAVFVSNFWGADHISPPGHTSAPFCARPPRPRGKKHPILPLATGFSRHQGQNNPSAPLAGQDSPVGAGE